MDKLVDNIAPDVFHLISSDPYYTETIMNLLPGAITEVIGDTSPELIGALGVRIMDRIVVGECDTTRARVWEERYSALFRYVKKNYATEYVDGAEYGSTLYGDFNNTPELD